MNETISIRRSRLGREVVHLIVQQHARSRHHNARTKAEIDGVGVTSAQYNLTSKTSDVQGYAAALTAMEEAAAANGFDDISVALFGSLASGDRALTVMASIQAPSSERLGEFFDQRLSSWMSGAVSNFDELRTPVIDFMMQCTTLSVNN